MARCAFGKVVVNDIFDPQYPFGADLEGRFLYVIEEDREWLLATFDFLIMWRSTCLDWRIRISEATGIPVSNIWLHTSQTHTGPNGLRLDGEPCRRLADISIPVIRDMIDQAEESEISYIVADLGNRFNLRREQYIPELGAVSVWLGSLQLEDDLPPFTQDPSIMLIGQWKPDLPAFGDRIYFDRTVDSQAALLVFRGKSGSIMGSLSRFSGHPDIVSSASHLGLQADQLRYHPDWPGYVRRTIDSELGGVGLCVNGPCGDVSIRYSWRESYEAADLEARRVGEGIASACIEEWRRINPDWKRLRLGSISTSCIKLPIRETLPHSRAELPGQEEHARRNKELVEEVIEMQERNDPPAHIKRMIDELEHQNCIPRFIDKWVNISDQELEHHLLEVELQAVSLNDLIFCGTPGETMTDTGIWLKASTVGSRLITCDQVNGYCNYLTTPTEYDEGGYSYWCGCLARDAEPLIRKTALQMITDVGGHRADNRVRATPRLLPEKGNVAV